MRTAAVVTALVLSAGLAAADPPAEPWRGGDAIEMSVNSWGRLINGWTVRGDGSGEVRTGRQGPGGYNDVTIEVRRLGPDPRRYAQVRTMLRAAEARAGRDLPCGSRTTDLPYGDVHWRSSAGERVLHFDSGCEASETRAIVDQISAADRLVTGWAANAPVEPSRKP